MHIKRSLAVIIGSLSGLTLMAASFGIYQGYCTWVFNNGNQVSDTIDKANIIIPDWSFDGEITNDGFYDDFKKPLTNEDSLGHKINFKIDYFKNGDDKVQDSTIYIKNASVNPNDSVFTDFSKVIFPAYYAETIDGIRYVHPISQIGKSFTFDNVCNNTEIEIPSTVTTIASKAFKDVTLKGVSYSTANNISSIESYAFAYTSLTSFTFGPKMSSFGDSAFRGSSLETVNFLDVENLASIDNYPFFECTSLTDVNINNSTIGTIKQSAFTSCTALKNINITNNSKITTIDYQAFKSFSSLNTLNILNSTVQTIYNAAFYNCSGLQKVDMTGSTINKINYNSFIYCEAMTMVDFTNATIGTIDTYAFFGCSKANVNFTNTKINTINYLAFGECDISGTVDLRESDIQLISSYAFAYQKNMSSLTFLLSFDIPDNGIGYAFATGCKTKASAKLYGGNQGQAKKKYGTGWYTGINVSYIQ